MFFSCLNTCPGLIKHIKLFRLVSGVRLVIVDESQMATKVDTINWKSETGSKCNPNCQLYILAQLEVCVNGISSLINLGECVSPEATSNFYMKSLKQV